MSNGYLKICAGFALSILMASSAAADDEAMQKYRDWLPGEIQSMPEEQRRSEVPMVYVMAANTARSPFGEITIQSHLNTLMYDGIGDLDRAKMQFQADLGEPQTGKLTVSQISTLQYRAERTRLTPVTFFPFRHGGDLSGDWASVRGTAVILGEQIAYPVNFVEIDCRRTEGLCDYRQIVLSLPDEKSWAQSYSVMEMVDETYKITRWDESRIDAVPLEEGECRINELRLNFATKEFFEIATNAPEGNCEMLLGGELPKLKKPRITQIVDGDPIVRERFAEIGRESFQLLSSEFRSKVEAAAAEAQRLSASTKSQRE